LFQQNQAFACRLPCLHQTDTTLFCNLQTFGYPTLQIALFFRKLFWITCREYRGIRKRAAPARSQLKERCQVRSFGNCQILAQAEIIIQKFGKP
jgi:hypothetical protein